MTLLRGTPRQVYRAYDESEFLAGAGMEDPLHREGMAKASARRGRALLISLLAAGAGAVIGLAAVAGVRTLDRLGASPNVTTGVMASAPLGSRIAGDAGRAGVASKRPTMQRRGSAAPVRRGARRARGSRRQHAAQTPSAGQPAQAQPIATVSPPAGGGPPGEAEFGFEQ
jgi:hypothetical protein